MISPKELLVKLTRPLWGRAAHPGVDIIVPIHGAPQATLRCLESVRRHATGDWQLRIIDDASPDPEMAHALRAFATAAPRARLHLQKEQRGFVATANHGMQLATAAGRDSLLLNSDTIVPAGFNRRLATTVYADANTGVATPYTNNGTICSIPEFLGNNPIPRGYNVESFDALVQSASLRLRPELVTAVGFCMYIRQTTLREVGFFDAEHFGRGYGEENDFCERAKARGWKIRLCDDLFVYHQGGASFGESAKILQEEHNQRMAELHPHYHQSVQNFVQQNPLAPLQARIRKRLLEDQSRLGN